MPCSVYDHKIILHRILPQVLKRMALRTNEMLQQSKTHATKASDLIAGTHIAEREN